jgi:hypothetical protein
MNKIACIIIITLSIISITTLSIATLSPTTSQNTEAVTWDNPALFGDIHGTVQTGYNQAGPDLSLATVDGNCYIISQNIDNNIDLAFGTVGVPCNATNFNICIYGNYTGNGNTMTLSIYNWKLDDWVPLYNFADCHSFTWHNETIPVNDGLITNYIQGNTIGNVNFRMAIYNCTQTDRVVLDCICLNTIYPNIFIKK